MNETTRKAIGNRLRSLRRDKEFTLRQLADAARVSERQLIKYEQGKVSPKLDTVCQIIGVFGVSLPTFFSEVDAA